jgi:hypothetical protein
VFEKPNRSSFTFTFVASHAPTPLHPSLQIHEAFYCIKPRVLLTIVASFGIGKSLGYSGLASWIAGGLVSFTLPMGACLCPLLGGAGGGDARCPATLCCAAFVRCGELDALSTPIWRGVAWVLPYTACAGGCGGLGVSVWGGGWG